MCEDHGLDHVQVVGLHDLMLKAIEPPAAMRVAAPTEAAASEAVATTTP